MILCSPLKSPVDFQSIARWLYFFQFSCSILAFPIFPRIHHDRPVVVVLVKLLDLVEQRKLSWLPTARSVLRLKREQVRSLQVLEHKPRVLRVDRMVVLLEHKIGTDSLGDINAHLLRAVGVVHVRIDHQECSRCVRSVDGASVIHVHQAKARLEATENLLFKILALEFGHFVADSGGFGVIDETLNVSGEAVVIIAGEIDAGAVFRAIDSEWTGRSGLVREYSVPALLSKPMMPPRPLLMRRKGMVLPAVMSVLAKDILMLCESGCSGSRKSGSCNLFLWCQPRAERDTVDQVCQVSGTPMYKTWWRSS